MLHAAAMLTGMFAVWLLWTQRWSSAVEIGVAIGAAALCVMFLSRFGGIGPAFARMPILLMAGVAHVGAVMRGAVRTIRAALAADVTLNPALVRVRTRVAGAEGRAALANLVSAEPGLTVVEIDAEGLLVHVMEEDGVDARDMGRTEARMLSAVGEEARS